MKSLFILLSLSLSLHSYGDEINEFLKKVYNDTEYSRTKINTAEIKAFKDHINSTFQEALAEKRSITPRSMYKDYYELAQDLHFSGFSKEEYFKRWQKKYKELYSKKVPVKKDPNVFWLREYEKVFNEHFILIRTSPKACAKPGEVSTITKCCNGAVSLPNTVKMNSCIEGSKSCDENSDCCSNACEKSDPNKPGICLVGNKCFVLKSLGETCNESSPYCERGYCREINKGTLGMGECKPQKKSCKENTECCSNKCSRGKCVQNQICTDCASGGVKPKRGQSCCEGYYKGPSGKCEIDMPPLVPFSSKVEKVFKTIVSELFPVAFAADESGEKDGLTEAQISKIEDRERECAKTHNTSSDEYKDCMRSVEDLKKSYKGEIEGKLTQEQIELVEGKRHACLAKYPSGSKELAGCMNTVDEFEKETKGQNIKLGIEPDKISSEDYLQKYEIPAVTAKTYSNIRKCEFNSFNDHWRDASNMEKNAELFLRAFEYVYSNEGTQDFWQEKNKDNIFKRANKVALNFRANRLKMFTSLREVDKKMACKCLAIFGPINYEADKQEFFNTSCEEEKAQLQATLGTDGEQSQIDGTSIDDDKTKDEKDIAEIEEVDKGAAGISHEKLLVEWLGLRRDAMTKKFVDNSENEKDLDELSAFISGYDFEEVWKDKVSGNNLVRNTEASDYIRSMGNNFYGDSEKLYSWYFIVKKGLFAILLIVVMVALAVFTFGLSLVAVVGGALVGFLLSSFGSSHGEGGEPGAYDLNHKKTKQGKFKEKHSFDRWYVGPRYDNYSPVMDTRCQIFARASSCLKTAYETKFNDQLHFLIDPTRPLFVPKDKVTLDLMPNYSQDYREMINDARHVGVQYLRTLGGAKTKDDNLKEGKSYGKTAMAHVKKAIEEMKFSPLEGKLKYQNFDEERKKSVVDGAKKYSLCLDLKVCGATEIEADAIGFGFLFEDDTEAQAFADYAYGLHYYWSSLSKNDYLGYPLLGLDAYFKAVAYNMKILGSMSIKRAFNYDEAHRLYQADWEKRKSDYNSLGEGSVGSGSRNITYSRPFYNTLRLLDFDGISNIEAFDGAVANVSNASSDGSSSSFNQAELDALSEARNHALRINKDVKEKQAYDALQSGKEGNAARQEAVGKFLTKLNAPGATIALKKFGGVNKDSAGNYNGLSGTVSSIGASSLGKKGSNKENAIKPFNLGDSGVSIGANSKGKGYGDSFSDDGEGFSSVKTANANGLSVEEANLLIEGIGKNKDLIEARESDTLFERVSKAYLRSYGRVLVRSKRSLRANSDSEVEKKEKVSDSKKDELRQLLDGN